eukprot:4382371-Prymnesium_polylepis.1
MITRTLPIVSHRGTARRVPCQSSSSCFVSRAVCAASTALRRRPSLVGALSRLSRERGLNLGLALTEALEAARLCARLLDHLP